MAQLLEIEALPIRVTAQGQWLHGNVPLHPRVADLFARHVVPVADGHYKIQLGYAQQAIEVADTAFSIRQLHLEKDTEQRLCALEVLVSDGQTERLEAPTLLQSTDNILYCLLLRHAMRVPARFTASQYHELAEYIVQQPHGAYALAMRQGTFVLEPYPAAGRFKG